LNPKTIFMALKTIFVALEIWAEFFRLGFMGFSSFPPDVVLGGRIPGKREEIVEERMGKGGGAMMQFTGARSWRDPRDPRSSSDPR
jgi:hypothetical protein